MENMDQFHLLSKFIGLPEEGREKMLAAIDAIQDAAYDIHKRVMCETLDEVNCSISDTVKFLLSARLMAFEKILNCDHSVNKEKLIEEVDAGKISLFAVTILDTIDKYCLHVSHVFQNSNTTVESNRGLLELGVSILFNVHGWMSQEVGDFASAAQYLISTTEIATRGHGSRHATNTKYEALRNFKTNVAAVARQKWESGSSLLHHQMAAYLVEDYTENRKHPFTFLPDKDKDDNYKSSSKVVLEVVKQVAKDMGRPDLISGQKKVK